MDNCIDRRGHYSFCSEYRSPQCLFIRILGSNSFYWDAQAIFIYDEADSSQSRQIRIGLYDGKHYGIGYTTDGGKTWQSAIDSTELYLVLEQ